MSQENDDIISMLLQAGVPGSAIRHCEVLAIEGLLLTSRRVEKEVSSIEAALTLAGLKILWYDLPEGSTPVELSRRVAAMDAVVEAMATSPHPAVIDHPFAVTGTYVAVVCTEGCKGQVLESLPAAMEAAGFGDLLLLLIDSVETRSIIHCATMSESVPPSVLTDESVDELSRLLSSTRSVEEFLNALK